MPPPKRLSKPLRRLLAFALVLLVLAAAFSALRLWLDAKGRAVLARFPDRRTAPQRPLSHYQEKPGTVAVSRLPVFAGIYSDDPAQREAARQLKRDLADFLNCRRFLYRNDNRIGTEIDFIETLRALKRPVPEGMTQAEAAAEYLKLASRFDPLLETLRNAASTAPWDFGPAIIGTDQTRKDQEEELASLISHGMWLMTVRTQAQSAVGQPDLALASWQETLGVLRVAGGQFPRSLSGRDALLQHWIIDSALAGVANGAWRDSDLATISRELETIDPLASYRLSVEKERDRVAATFAAYAGDHSLLASAVETPDRPLDQAIRAGALALTDDTQIAANAAIVDKYYQLLEDSFDYQNHRFTPPPSEDYEPVRLKHDPFNLFYFLYARLELGTSKLYDQPFQNQETLNHARLAVALEQYRRTNGSHPDSLDALRASFPSGLPITLRNSTPYFYRVEPDGNYRIWEVGLNGIDDGGLDPDEHGFSFHRSK